VCWEELENAIEVIHERSMRVFCWEQVRWCVITRKDPRIVLVRSRLFLREQFYGISDLVDP
jgi:hypothetical protein